MAELITLIEKNIPKFKEKSEFDSIPEYINHISETIERSLERTKSINIDDGYGKEPMDGITIFEHQGVSPVYKIRNLLAYKPLSLDDIKEIMQQASNIKAIQNSLCKRGTTAEKMNLYLCWSLYEKGISISEIYDISNKNCDWNSSSKDNVINKIKKWANKFRWQRNIS
jgi:hypothetical protein|tara:strand:- start:4641 stop:5147 length:507 start_codon:yes stop_codon:yes gene_type:complete